MPEFTQCKLSEEVSTNFNKIIEICQRQQFEADSGVGMKYRTLTRAAAQVLRGGAKSHPLLLVPIGEDFFAPDYLSTGVESS